MVSCIRSIGPLVGVVLDAGLRAVRMIGNKLPEILSVSIINLVALVPVNKMVLRVICCESLLGWAG